MNVTKYITMEEIMVEMEALFGKEMFDGSAKDGLQKLSECSGSDITCKSGVPLIISCYLERGDGVPAKLWITGYSLCGLVPLPWHFKCGMLVPETMPSWMRWFCRFMCSS